MKKVFTSLLALPVVALSVVGCGEVQEAQTNVDLECVAEVSTGNVLDKEFVNRICSLDPHVKAQAQAEMIGGRVEVAPRDLNGLTSNRESCDVEKGAPVVVTNGTFISLDGCFVYPF